MADLDTEAAGVSKGKRAVLVNEPRVKCRFCRWSFAALYREASGREREGWEALQTHVMCDHTDQLAPVEFKALFGYPPTSAARMGNGESMSFSLTFHGHAGPGMDGNGPEEIAAVQAVVKATREAFEAQGLNLGTVFVYADCHEDEDESA